MPVFSETMHGKQHYVTVLLMYYNGNQICGLDVAVDLVVVSTICTCIMRNIHPSLLGSPLVSKFKWYTNTTKWYSNTT